MNAMNNQKFSLMKVRLDSGGYDVAGRYWGVGAALYFYQSEDYAISGHLRAVSRDAARSEVMTRHPGARFFR